MMSLAINESHRNYTSKSRTLEKTCSDDNSWMTFLFLHKNTCTTLEKSSLAGILRAHIGLYKKKEKLLQNYHENQCSLGPLFDAIQYQFNFVSITAIRIFLQLKY